MGKKGSWFSAIKRVFIPNNNSTRDNNNKPTNEKKGRRGKLKYGESRSFIPLFREPSSIEKILEEAEEEKLFRQHSSASSEQSTKLQQQQPFFIQRAHPPNAASSRINRRRTEQPTQHLSATRIQAAYRGYVARRSFRALRGLVRLQGVIRGQNVKRQTANAMKMMQLLVKVQTQIQSRRIQMLENQAIQRRQAQKIDREFETNLSKWTVQTEAGQNDEWDDSMLPKEEREARLHRKVEAMMKRERAMSYAYSHKLWKATPKSENAGAMMGNIRHGGYPWWWNWLERQLPPSKTTPDWSSTKNFKMTPQQPKPSPLPANTGLDNLGILTPSSTKSVFPTRSKPLFNNTPSRTPLSNGFGLMRYSKNDDEDSLTSCPPFSVPNYMTSTASTNAKARACSNPKERFPTPETPINDSKKRFSFPLTPNFSSFKWNNNNNNRGSNEKDLNSLKVIDQHQPIHAMGNTSIDSTVSMPAVVSGRKPFNRFV